MGGRNAKVEKDSPCLRNPESFQYGRDVFEVTTSEPYAFLVSGKVGARRIQRDVIAVDTDEGRAWRGVEQCPCMSGSSEGGVHEDPSVCQSRDEELDDSVEEYRAVIHCSGIYRPSARLATATMPRKPPTDVPLIATSTKPWLSSLATLDFLAARSISLITTPVD